MKTRYYENNTNREWTLCLKLNDRDQTTKKTTYRKSLIQFIKWKHATAYDIRFADYIFFYEITWFAVEIVDLLIISQTEVSIVNDKFWTQPTITITLEMLLFHCIVNEPAFPFLGMIWDYEWGLTKIVMAFWQQESIFIWIQCFHEI